MSIGTGCRFGLAIATAHGRKSSKASVSSRADDAPDVVAWFGSELTRHPVHAASISSGKAVIQ